MGILSALLSGVLFFGAGAAAASVEVGAEEVVQAAGDSLVVDGYSVPSFVDWNNDDRGDLIVGEGGGIYSEGKVRVYLNIGTEAAPVFDTFFYVQSEGHDLSCPASGCLGVFPRVLHWDDDGHKDLLLGLTDGKVMIYLNQGSDAAPDFGAGSYLRVGPSAMDKVDIDVGSRATSIAADWNGDERKDLIVGAIDGKIHVFINEGTDSEPDFQVETFAQQGDEDLDDPTGRTSPVFCRVDADELPDLLLSNTLGQLHFYANVGSLSEPLFAAPELVNSEGVAIDLPGSLRGRPAVCDWNSDGNLDVLLGYGDGLVRLYPGLRMVAVGESPPLALVGELSAYPNPFNPRLNVAFTVAEETPVRVVVYDLAGRRVTTLGDAWLAPGRHQLSWSGQNAAGRAVPSGLYLVELSYPGGQLTRKLTLAR